MSIIFCVKVKNDPNINFEMPVSLFFYKVLLAYKEREPLLQKAFPVFCLGEFSDVSLSTFAEGLECLIKILSEKKSKSLTVYSFRSQSDPFGCFSTCTTRVNGTPVMIEGGIGKCEIRSYKLDSQEKPISLDRIVDISDQKEITTDDMVIQIIGKKKKIKELPELVRMHDFILTIPTGSMLSFCIKID